MDELVLKRFVLIAVSIVVALGLGSWIADGSFFWPAITALVCLLVFLAWAKWPVSSMLMAMLLFGYIVGNRGFAQLYLSDSLPLLPAEFGLAICGVILIVQSAFRRELPIRRDPLNLLIIVWLVLGAGRLCIDIRTYGIVALRDAAMVYYALFFFISQSLGADATGRRWLFGGLTAALLILPFTFVAFDAAPEWFSDHILVREIPLIIYKGDIVASCLGAGTFYFYHFAHQGRRSAWLAVLICFLGAVFPLARAALMGMALAALVHGAARRWRMLVVLGLSAPVLGVLSLIWVILSGQPVMESRVVRIVEYATTVLNVSGAGNVDSYSDEQNVKGNPIDNNQFRLIWWKTVINDTWGQGALFGVGFGRDIAAQFLVEYGLVGDTDFTTRSPHSFLVTTFARMGLVGLVSLLAVVAAMLSGTWRAAQRWKRDTQASEAPALWAMCWVFLISACFGVVLEGPMGAVVFWTLLGLAHLATVQPEESTVTDALALQPSEASNELAATP